MNVTPLLGAMFSSLVLGHTRQLNNGGTSEITVHSPIESPRITVFVYNYASVSPEVLLQTEAEASRIYQRAGLEIHWLDCPLSSEEANRFPTCQVSPGPAKLAVRLMSRSMGQRLPHEQDSFGFAMFPEDGSFATVSNVFSGHAQDFASDHGLPYSVMLGHLIAHELGHLLLGVGSHSSTGIMHVPWHLKELKSAAQGLLNFTPEQADRMQRNTELRLALSERRGVQVEKDR